MAEKQPTKRSSKAAKPALIIEDDVECEALSSSPPPPDLELNKIYNEDCILGMKKIKS